MAITQDKGVIERSLPYTVYKQNINTMKSVLLNTTVIGSSVKLPRHPRLIIGEPDDYIHGDILDANAVKKEINDAISRVDIDGDLVSQRLQEVEQELIETINTKIAEIVGTAPEALDTLKEIADALGNDPEFASKILSLINQVKEENEEQSAAIEELQNESEEAHSWNDVAA